MSPARAGRAAAGDDDGLAAAVTAAAKSAPEPREVNTPPVPVTVQVLAPYQVFHEGEARGPGSQIATNSHTAEPWLRCGWVSVVEPEPAPRRR